jgi:CyaY protein
MEEQEFKTRADEALSGLYKKLSHASDQYDFEPDFNAGALAIEFEGPKTKFVVSPNTPVRQIWVSAHSKSFKLDWDESRKAFVLQESGQTLDELIASAIEKLLGEPVAL